MELDYVRLRDIKPALSEYLQESLNLLKQSEVPDEKAIHDIRVLMKKGRSVLKLAAPQLDYSYKDRDIASLREVGNLTRRWRETSVLRKLLKELRKEYPDIFERLGDNENLNKIFEKKKSLSDDKDDLAGSGKQISLLLTKTSYRIRFQQMNMINPQTLIKELDLTYRKVVERYVACRNRPKPASLHKLRKRTKDFLYQLYIFKPLNPSKIKSLEKKLENMTQNLGKVNDLEQIIEILNYDYKDNTNSPALDELVIKIHEAQDKYLSKVWPIAFQIFCPGQNLVNVLGFRLLVI